MTVSDSHKTKFGTRRLFLWWLMCGISWLRGHPKSLSSNATNDQAPTDTRSRRARDSFGEAVAAVILSLRAK